MKLRTKQISTVPASSPPKRDHRVRFANEDDRQPTSAPTTKSRCVGLTGSRNYGANTSTSTSDPNRSVTSIPYYCANDRPVATVLHGRVIRKQPQQQNDIYDGASTTGLRTNNTNNKRMINMTSSNNNHHRSKTSTNDASLSSSVNASRYLLERKAVYSELVEATKQFHDQVTTLEDVIKTTIGTSRSSSDSNVDEPPGMEKEWRVRLLLTKAQEVDTTLWKQLYEYETTLWVGSSSDINGRYSSEQDIELRNLQTSCMKLHRDFKRSHKVLLMCLSLLNDSKDLNHGTTISMTGDALPHVLPADDLNHSDNIAGDSSNKNKFHDPSYHNIRTTPMVEAIGWTGMQAQLSPPQKQEEQSNQYEQPTQRLNMETKEEIDNAANDEEDVALKLSRSMSPIYTSFHEPKSKKRHQRKKKQEEKQTERRSYQYEDDDDDDEDYQEDFFDQFTRCLGFDGKDELEGKNISIKFCGTVPNSSTTKDAQNGAQDTNCLWLYDLWDDLYDQNCNDSTSKCSRINSNNLDSKKTTKSVVSREDKKSSNKDRPTLSTESKVNDSVDVDDDYDDIYDDEALDRSMTKYNWYQQFQDQLHTMKLDLLHVRSNNTNNEASNWRETHHKTATAGNPIRDDNDKTPLDEA